MSEDATTVFVVDDDPSALRSVSRLLRLTGFRVAEFGSAAEFLAQLQPGVAGCVITDLKMPGLDGLGLQQTLKQTGNALPVIFLSGHGDIPTSVLAMRHGAEDFLVKSAPKEMLIDAIRRALVQDEHQRADRARRDAVQQLLDTLSTREREVLDHVLQGKPNKQIAADLAIHERTVKLHRTSLTRKLGVHSVAELARLVATSAPPTFPFGQ